MKLQNMTKNLIKHSSKNNKMINFRKIKNSIITKNNSKIAIKQDLSNISNKMSSSNNLKSPRKRKPKNLNLLPLKY